MTAMLGCPTMPFDKLSLHIKEKQYFKDKDFKERKQIFGDRSLFMNSWGVKRK